MKIAVWGACAAVALLWTGLAALLAQLVQWTGQGLASSASGSISAVVATASAPGWLAAWIDPASWGAAQQAVAGGVASLAGLLPAFGDAVTWLVPLVWVVWGAGLVALVAFAFLATALVGRFGRALGGGTA